MSVPRSTLRQFQRCRLIGSWAPAPIWRRSYSSSNGALQGGFEAMKAEMLARAPQLSWDVMSPTNSSLLNIALADFIPEDCQARAYQSGVKTIEKVHSGRTLPQGHHLVYFPLQKTASALCPDGTDPFHHPGAPFERRMWAGGTIDFMDNFKLDSSPVVCWEKIEDVTVQGAKGEGKIFVSVLREYMKKREFEITRKKGQPLINGIRERRNLVFMRGVSKEQARENLSKALRGRSRIIKVPNSPDFSITLTPTPTLLFHYSALTFNAHLIHLDPGFCREMEGHPNLLVHGPLTLTLMLAVLNSRLKPDEKVRNINYRNVAPLYVNQPLRVCVRLISSGGDFAEGNPRRWEVWVEGQDGGLKVKGTAYTL
ncbi:hypothetical protein F5Y04DRAFT_252465 [Hypomontagnella monticulosa]|nr:hypothetical protein F5Y04DRAFT_252465 [Hypomontagnella monticulosa]